MYHCIVLWLPSPAALSSHNWRNDVTCRNICNVKKQYKIDDLVRTIVAMLKDTVNVVITELQMLPASRTLPSSCLSLLQDAMCVHTCDVGLVSYYEIVHFAASHLNHLCGRSVLTRNLLMRTGRQRDAYCFVCGVRGGTEHTLMKRASATKLIGIMLFTASLADDLYHKIVDGLLFPSWWSPTTPRKRFLRTLVSGKKRSLRP